MRNLLNFIVKYSTWFVFVFYVLLSCAMLFNSSPYQQSIYLTSANSVTSAFNSAHNSVTQFFRLPEVNEELEARNAQLESEVKNLREQIKDYKTITGDTLPTKYAAAEDRFSYTLATVIGGTTHHPRNYININRGAADGIRPGMGVLDHNGVVGIVGVVGPHTARKISLLNDKQKVSVKIKDTNTSGVLGWHGSDPFVGYLEDIPRHTKFNIGDTVVTSGYSSTFPYGIPVGIIMGRVRGSDDNNFTLKVRFVSDFTKLSGVRIINDVLKTELDTLANYDLK